MRRKSVKLLSIVLAAVMLLPSGAVFAQGITGAVETKKITGWKWPENAAKAMETTGEYSSLQLTLPESEEPVTTETLKELLPDEIIAEIADDGESGEPEQTEQPTAPEADTEPGEQTSDPEADTEPGEQPSNQEADTEPGEQPSAPEEGTKPGEQPSAPEADPELEEQPANTGETSETDPLEDET